MTTWEVRVYGNSVVLPAWSNSYETYEQAFVIETGLRELLKREMPDSRVIVSTIRVER